MTSVLHATPRNIALQPVGVSGVLVTSDNVRAIVGQQLNPQPVAVTAGATITPNLSTSASQRITLTANTTIANPTLPSTTAAPGVIAITLIEDGVGGHSYTWGSQYKNGPVITAGAANTRALFAFMFDGVNLQYIGGATAFS